MSTAIPGSVAVAVDVGGTFADAVARTEKALAAEGFGILTRIDVAATLKQKLGEDMAPFLILGACAPPLAHRAITAAPEIGVLLPCNVVVRERAGGGIRVEAIDARTMSAMIRHPEVEQVAAEVAARLGRVLEAVRTG